MSHENSGYWWRFVPYEADYKLLAKWRRAGNILLVIVSILSVAVPYLSSYYNSQAILLDAFQFASYLAIIAYYITDVVAEVFLYPAASRKRRVGFIDNSLGSRFLNLETRNYYSNELLDPGPYKMSVNCFENCFFTYNIAATMTSSVAAKCFLLSGVFFTAAYFGLQGNVIALPILQILLSTLFVTELVYHLAFVSRLRILLERFEIHFSETMDNKQKRNDPKYPTLMLLEYETTLAFNKAPLSDKVYVRLRTRLGAEWEQVKERYEIS